jgi:hypothetical protein
LVEIKLGDVRDENVVVITVELDGFASLPETKGMSESLVLEEDSLAFFAGVEERGVVADLNGAVVVVKLGIDQLAFDFDRLG